jgi:hypothetical protein
MELWRSLTTPAVRLHAPSNGQVFAVLLNRLPAAPAIGETSVHLRCSQSASGNSRSEVMNLRSLALLVFIFGASAAFAGYLGMKYSEPVSQQRAQPTTPHALAAPPSPSPALSKPGASAVPPMPARETAQTPTPQSASERKSPQEVTLPARNVLEMSGSNTLEAARTTGSQAMETPKCNRDACANAYRSFDAGDCTYQPTNGPRRMCKK